MYLDDSFRGDHDAQVNDFVVVAAEHDAHDVLPDVVDVPLHCRKEDLPGIRGIIRRIRRQAEGLSSQALHLFHVRN